MATKTITAKSAIYSAQVGTQKYTISGGMFDNTSTWQIVVEELRDFGGLIIPNRFWEVEGTFYSDEDLIDALWENINDDIREFAETSFDSVDIQAEVDEDFIEN
jgi:hypothetical protein